MTAASNLADFSPFASRRRPPAHWSELLGALFKKDDGLIELRALPSRNRDFVVPRDVRRIERFARQNADEDIYFGVAARQNSKSGDLRNCSSIRAVFVDIDFKTFGSEADAHRGLTCFPLEPSVVVESGGGLHVYWFLENAVDLRTDAASFKRLLRRTARALDGDIAAAEPARILRLPGTRNHKYTPPREVQIVG